VRSVDGTGGFCYKTLVLSFNSGFKSCFFFLGSFSNIKFVAKLPANPPLKETWKESVFSLTAGVEDRSVTFLESSRTGQ